MGSIPLPSLDLQKSWFRARHPQQTQIWLRPSKQPPGKQTCAPSTECEAFRRFLRVQAERRAWSGRGCSLEPPTPGVAVAGSFPEPPSRGCLEVAAWRKHRSWGGCPAVPRPPSWGDMGGAASPRGGPAGPPQEYYPGTIFRRGKKLALPEAFPFVFQNHCFPYSTCDATLGRLNFLVVSAAMQKACENAGTDPENSFFLIPIPTCLNSPDCAVD